MIGKMLVFALPLVIASCSAAPKAQRESPAEPPRAAPPAPPRTATEQSGELPIPEAVLRLHKRAVDPALAEAALGPPIGVVTLHDAQVGKGGDYHALVIFQDGSLATWRQTPSGIEKPFTAKLSAEETARLQPLIEAISRERALARSTFSASTTVMGVSTRVARQSRTRFYDHAALPAPLSQLVAMATHRLEEANAAP